MAKVESLGIKRVESVHYYVHDIARSRRFYTEMLGCSLDHVNERISLVFKHLRVVRMVDRKRNTLVYMTYSDRVIEGSPQNSVTAVPVRSATRNSISLMTFGQASASTQIFMRN